MNVHLTFWDEIQEIITKMVFVFRDKNGFIKQFLYTDQ